MIRYTDVATYEKKNRNEIRKVNQIKTNIDEFQLIPRTYYTVAYLG